MKSNILSKLRGFQDISEDLAEVYEYLFHVLQEISKNYYAKRVFLPIVEKTEIFKNNIGLYSDIVAKEMYTFYDKKERSLTLRPEATVGTSRFIFENKLLEKNKNQILKYYYIGPMFRYERPQNGRFRQFYQYGVEFINISNYFYVIELIQMANSILKILAINNVRLEINILGSKNTIEEYSKILKYYFSNFKNMLCENCLKRIDNNVLRILDCKADTKKSFFKNVPTNESVLSKNDKQYFKYIKKLLDLSDIKYNSNNKLVRGLDYYSGIVFEFINELDGNAIIAGGDYEDVSTKLGYSESVKCTGFAIGIYRLAKLFIQNSNTSKLIRNRSIYIINLDEYTINYSILCSYFIRLLNFNVNVNYQPISNLKKILKKIANKYDYLIILEKEYAKNNEIKIKNLKTFNQKIIQLEELKQYLDENIN